jgi:hypothetical protein
LMHSGYNCSLHLYQNQYSHGSLHYQLIPLSSGLIWNNSSTTVSSLASMRLRLLIWPDSSKGTMEQLLDSFRDSERS